MIGAGGVSGPPREHPIGLVEDNEAVGSVGEPFDRLGVGGMTELEVLDNPLVEIGEEHEAAVAEGLGEEPRHHGVGDQRRVARRKRLPHQRHQRYSLAPALEDGAGRGGEPAGQADRSLRVGCPGRGRDGSHEGPKPGLGEGE